MKKIKRLAIATAATATLAASVLVAPATASAVGGWHAQFGTYCTPWEDVYGRGGYTFTDFRTCVDVREGADRQYVRVETDKTTYYWGGAWYSAAPVYQADIEATTKFTALYESGYSGEGTNHWVQTSRSGHNYTDAFTLDRCGAHRLDVTYQQRGPYYRDDDSMIDVNRSYDDFVIPCTHD
ncbi:hypothetical protein ACIRPT_02675 [Streptomyces sp. NPDC101227]|uniref:hypothetical protein n=1 Tax=Streptomyces sp. NPDC101227 TaxID=3366136 RepID=UPI003807A8B7